MGQISCILLGFQCRTCTPVSLSRIIDHSHSFTRLKMYHHIFFIYHTFDIQIHLIHLLKQLICKNCLQQLSCTKIGALRRLKRLVPANTMLLLYKSFVLSHFEYCNSLLMGIGKTLNKKLEDANYYGLRTIMNMGKSADYESILRMADMNTLEHRRIEQSLMIFFKCFKENGQGYVANLFKPRVTPYNLRSNGLNVVQTSYNSRFLHGSYAYMMSHIWNQLPSAVKNAPNASSFRRLLTKLNFKGCQCSNCL